MKNKMIFLLLVLFTIEGKAQEITVKDRAEINYQAELLISELENLMNIISYADITPSEISELIQNSYGNSKNKIFYNPTVVVEDDINPLNTNHTHARDVSIEKYLKDLDLLYSKSTDPTISFKNFIISSLKKKNYLYVRVYFESTFSGKHKEIKQVYKTTKRIAEIRADKNNKQWKTQIVSIIFDDPARPINGEDGNVLLAAAKPDVTADPNTSERVNRESMEEMVKKETKKLFEDYKVRRDSAFAIAINSGNKALADKNYLAAVEFYTEAQNINPYEITPKLRINEVTRAILQEKQNEKNSDESLKKSGEKEESARNYEVAKNYYQQALAKQPNDPALLAKIKSLDANIRAKAQFESKYISGDYEAAIRDYTNLIKENKNNPDYFLGRGKCYYKLKDYKKALLDFSEAIRLDVNFIEAIDNRANLYTELKEYHNAMADYSVMISINRSEPSYFVKRAKLKVLLNDYAGAVADYEEAIKASPKTAEFFYEKGVLNSKLKNYERAKSDFGNAIALEGDNASYFYQRGLNAYAMNDLHAAGMDFKIAKEKNLSESFTKNIEAIAEEIHKKSQSAFRNKEYKNSIALADNTLMLSPEFSEAWLQRGDALLELKENEKAIESYEKALSFNEKLYMAYYKLALMYAEKNDFAKTIVNAEKSAAINGSYLPAQLLLARGLWSMNKNVESIAVLNKALAKNPGNAEVYWYLGKCYYTLKNYKKAIEEFGNAIKKSPAQAEIYYDLGLTELAIADYKNAISNLTKCIELGYETSGAFRAIGIAFLEIKSYEDAVKCFNFAVDKDKAEPGSYILRGKTNAKLKKYDLALKDYQKAFDLNKELSLNTDFLCEKGFLELNQNLNKEALTTFGDALIENDQLAIAMYGRGCALSQMGKEEEALAAFDAAFKTGTIAWQNIKNDSFLQPFIKNKRFQDLVKKYL